jgi:hypothetical protein
MTSSRLPVAFVILMLGGAAWSPRDAAAQTAKPVPPGKATPKPSAGTRPNYGRFEIFGGVGWIGATDLGSVTAQLAGNGVPSGTPVTLFEADAQIESGPRLDGRLAWRLTRTLAIEGGVTMTRTHVRTDTGGDFEQAPPASLTEELSEYAFEGGVVVHIPKLTFAGARGRLFITGGGGYLRQVHEEATVIETGGLGFAGGGVTYALRQRGRGFPLGIGLRGDVRINVRSGGLEVEADHGTHISPSTSGGVFIRF